MTALRSRHGARSLVSVFALALASLAASACGGAEGPAEVGPGGADDAGASDASPTCAQRVGAESPYACPGFDEWDGGR